MPNPCAKRFIPKRQRKPPASRHHHPHQPQTRSPSTRSSPSTRKPSQRNKARAPKAPEIGPPGPFISGAVHLLFSGFAPSLTALIPKSSTFDGVFALQERKSIVLGLVDPFHRKLCDRVHRRPNRAVDRFHKGGLTGSTGARRVGWPVPQTDSGMVDWFRSPIALAMTGSDWLLGSRAPVCTTARGFDASEARTLTAHLKHCGWEYPNGANRARLRRPGARAVSIQGGVWAGPVPAWLSRLHSGGR